MSIQRASLDSSCDPAVMSCLAENELSDRTNRSYWDIYTDDQIPVLERAIGGALLPVAIVGGLLGAGCGGTAEEEGPPPDLGSDPVPDKEDNPPPVSNDDLDNDGIGNDADNCNPSYEHSIAESYNPDQVDTDNDGIGDVCEGADWTGESLRCERIAINSTGDIVFSAFHYLSVGKPREDIGSCRESYSLYLYPHDPTDGTRQEVIVDSVRANGHEHVSCRPTPFTQCNGRKMVDINNAGQIATCWNKEEDVYCQTYDLASRSALSSARLMSQDVVDNRSERIEETFSVQIGDTGTVIFAWDEMDSDQQQVLARIYDTDLEPLSDTLTVGEGEHPGLAVRDNGEFAIAWQSPGNYSYHVKKFSADGVANGNVMGIDGVGFSQPALSWNQEGTLAVAYNRSTDFLGAIALIDEDGSISEPRLIPWEITDAVIGWHPFSYEVAFTAGGQILIAGTSIETGFFVGNWFVASLGPSPDDEFNLLRDLNLTGDSTSALAGLRALYSLDANESRAVGIGDGNARFTDLVTLAEEP